jgi:hypothetical protein
MRKPSRLIVSLVIVAFSLAIVACGGMNMMMSNRQLQSITVSPNSADAMNFPAGTVHFMAMGTYTMAPMSGTPPVLWSLGNPFSQQPVPAGVSIDANGMARCMGFVGMVEVDATSPMDPNMNVVGMAQLTCP